MAEGASFVGFRIGRDIVTNGRAARYLDRLFRSYASKAGLMPGKSALFMSESDAHRHGYPFAAGEGNVKSMFDIEHNGLDHKIVSVIVVGHDEFFDGSRAGEPADAWHFLCVLAAIEHEFRHVCQHTVLERDDTELGRLFFLNQWGTYKSDGFRRETYYRDINEIDAQYLALKKLGRRVSRFKDFGLVDVECTGDGFKVMGVSSRFTRRTPADTAVCFYQHERGKSVRHDFIENPEGSYKSARTVFRRFRESFLNAVYGNRTWTKDESGDDRTCGDIDDYVVNDGSDRLSAGFRANPSALDKFKAEKDGFRQLLIMASVSTAGFGDKALQDALCGRIWELFDVKVSGSVVLRESVEEREKTRIARSVLGRKIAYWALMELAWDVRARMREPDVEFDGPGG